MHRREFLKVGVAGTVGSFLARLWHGSTPEEHVDETPESFKANSWVAPQKAYSEGLRLTAPVDAVYLITATVGGAAGMRLLHNDMHAGPDATWGIEKYQTVRNLLKGDTVKVQAYHHGPDPKILDAKLHVREL